MTTTRNDYTGNGVTTVFAFAFKAMADAWVKPSLDGVDLTSGYTVARNADQDASPGGTVTFTNAPGFNVAVGIRRVVPLTQEVALSAYSPFPAKTVEHAVDQVTMQAQQLDAAITSEATTRAAADVAHDQALADIALGNPGSANAALVTPSGATLTKTLAAWISYLAPWLTRVQILFDEIGAYLTGSALGDNGETLTLARTSIATYQDSSGALATAAANTARVNHWGLVAEPAATSVIAQPNNLTVSWSTNGVGVAAPTRTANSGDVTAPDGTNTATKVVYPAVPSAGNVSNVWVGATLTADRYEFSFWARSSSPICEFWFEVQDGASFWQSKKVTLNDREWKRCSMIVTGHGAGTRYFGLGTSLAAGTDQTATAGGTCYIWGVEAKPLPGLSSLTGTVARTADVASISAGPIGANQGAGSIWVRPQWAAGVAATDRTILSAPGFSLVYVAASSVWRLTIGGQVVDSAAQTFLAYTEHQIRWRYEATGRVRLIVNQETEVVSAGAPTSLSPGSTLYLGNNGTVGAGVFLRRIILEPAGTDMLPVATPTAAERVATLGDSIVYGYNVTTGWVTALAALLGSPWRVENFGINSDVVANMLVRWRSQIRGIGFGYLVLAGGINDIRVGTSAATVWTSLKAIVDEAKADGLTVVLCTVTPFKNYSGQWTAGKQTELDSLNTTIRAYCSSQALRLVDSYVAMVDPGNAYTYLAAYDQGDNLHPNQAGNTALAALVKVQIP
jgi:lysophospholipase L1-like esterase